MKINKAISKAVSAVGSAFKKKKDNSVKDTGMEKKASDVDARKKQDKKYTETIFSHLTQTGQPNWPVFRRTRRGDKSAPRMGKHVNKAKFQKKAKLKRRKARA